MYLGSADISNENKLFVLIQRALRNSYNVFEMNNGRGVLARQGFKIIQAKANYKVGPLVCSSEMLVFVDYMFLHFIPKHEFDTLKIVDKKSDKLNLDNLNLIDKNISTLKRSVPSIIAYSNIKLGAVPARGLLGPQSSNLCHYATIGYIIKNFEYFKKSKYNLCWAAFS